MEHWAMRHRSFEKLQCMDAVGDDGTNAHRRPAKFQEPDAQIDLGALSGGCRSSSYQGIGRFRTATEPGDIGTTISSLLLSPRGSKRLLQWMQCAGLVVARAYDFAVA
mmetsp:Transcript_55526/g.180195  ORF Transcript_55526/g.180195 Transcript_55526/m.180195 type:complete len:108 (-) Transcript_55526:281-604(-)